MIRSYSLELFDDVFKFIDPIMVAQFNCYLNPLKEREGTTF